MSTKRIVFLYIPPIANAVGNQIVDPAVLDGALFFTGTQRPDIMAEVAGSTLKLNFALAGTFLVGLAKAEAENRLHAFSALNVEWPAQLKQFLVERGLYLSSQHAQALHLVENGDYNSELPVDCNFSVFGVNSDFSSISN